MKRTSSFKIGNNFSDNLILIIELSLSKAKLITLFLSTNFFWPILK